MSRLPTLRPGDLDGPQSELYQAIAGGARAQGPQAFALTDDQGGLQGPFNAMLLSPQVGTALQALGSTLRFQTQLSERAREIAILVVAHHWRSIFEIYAHEAVGRQAGLGPQEFASLSDGRFDAIADEHERLVAQTTAALVSTGDLDDAQYAAAQLLGERVLFELATLVGYYATLALQLRLYRVGAPASAPASALASAPASALASGPAMPGPPRD